MSFLVRRKDLRSLGIDYSATWLRYLESEGRFPKRFYITPYRVAWMHMEINEFLANRAAADPDNGVLEKFIEYASPPIRAAAAAGHRQVVRLKPRRYAQPGLGTLKVMPERQRR